MVLEFTSQDLTQESLSQKGTVLVDLWVPWCGPCRMVAPIVEKLSEEYDGKVTFGKLNIDDYTETAVALGVNSIPTLILFKDGVEQERVIGAYPKPKLVEFIERNL